MRTRHHSSLTRAHIATKSCHLDSKQIRATFQCFIDQVFSNQIRQNIYAYVDDILVKSSNIEKHPEDLEVTLDKLKQYKMKLNLTKCSFGIKEGKFLEFYVG